MNSAHNEREALTHLELVLRQVRMEATGINSYEFVDAEGKELPPFTAGAHVDVHIAPGVIRQYSLCNDPSERHRYVIAVLRDERGRGGSRAMHDDMHVASRIRISVPRNNFTLADDARKVILIAGGIGVTPLKSMVHHLESQWKDYDLHYCAKGPEYAAFRDELQRLAKIGNVHCHFDGGNPEKGIDLKRLLAEHQTGAHVYYCGPGGFMDACKQAASHWPEGTVHCEHFKAPAQSRPDTEADTGDGYAVEIASTGQTLHVSPLQNLAEVLQEAGLPVETSCQSGLCGTCKVRYLSGDIDHQDYILNEDERQHCLTPCVSRARGGTVVLDL